MLEGPQRKRVSRLLVKSRIDAQAHNDKMPQAKPKFSLTTPIYYTNGLPHIGHTYATVVADTIRRYKRMCGYEVVMTTGTDEHGVNVERAAKKAGIAESEFVANMADTWRALWDELGVAADEFIRTKIGRAHV